MNNKSDIIRIIYFNEEVNASYLLYDNETYEKPRRFLRDTFYHNTDMEQAVEPYV